MSEPRHVYFSENRQTRRAYQRRFGAKIRVLKSDGKDAGPAFETQSCGRCWEEGRGIVPLSLHPAPTYRPCPDAAVMLGETRVAVTGLGERPFWWGDSDLALPDPAPETPPEPVLAADGRIPIQWPGKLPAPKKHQRRALALGVKRGSSE